MPILENRIRYKQLKLFLIRILHAGIHYRLIYISIIIILSILGYQKHPQINNIALEFLGKALTISSDLYHRQAEYWHDIRHRLLANKQGLPEGSDTLKLLQKKLEILEAENRELKHSLSFSEYLGRQYISTWLLSISTTPYEHLAIINVGASKGAQNNQVVVANGMLIGRITEVMDNFAKVALLTDFRMRISVIASKTRQRCIVSGNNAQVLELRCEGGAGSLEYGEILVTAGGSQYYPPGLLVAQVVINKIGKIVAEPLVKLSQVRIVHVITY